MITKPPKGSDCHSCFYPQCTQPGPGPLLAPCASSGEDDHEERDEDDDGYGCEDEMEENGDEGKDLAVEEQKGYKAEEQGAENWEDEYEPQPVMVPPKNRQWVSAALRLVLLRAAGLCVESSWVKNLRAQ